MHLRRRDFLKHSLGAAALVSFGGQCPRFLGRWAVAAGEGPENDTVLVVVQLTGGNDGLNTVVPFDNDEYARRRPTLRLRAPEVHKFHSDLGFHPRMEGFLRLWDGGNLTIVQGVGYPDSSRDHAAALRDWQTAKPQERAVETGAFGRAVDALRGTEDNATRGVFVGAIEQPFGLRTAREVVPSLHEAGDAVLLPLGETTRTEEHTARLEALCRLPRAGPSSPLLAVACRGLAEACAASRRVAAVLSRREGTTGYPSFRLAAELRAAAELIRAGLGVRIVHVELGGGGLGGFDNHASQAKNHGALLHQLSESVAAFVRDLERDGTARRVLLMTFSEFGRTVTENGRRGTDHGAAQPIFLVGGQLEGGLVGPHPSLVDLDGGGLRCHTDFRRVYTTVLEKWLGVESSTVLGERFEPLNVLGSRSRARL